MDILEILCSTELFNVYRVKQTDIQLSKYKLKKNKEGREPVKPKSVFAQLKPITLQEIKQFFSIVIHMTTSHKSSLCTYWSIFHKIDKKVKKQDHLLAIKWKDTRDAFFLTSANEDEL